MAEHVHLKDVFMEDDKYHYLVSRLIYYFNIFTILKFYPSVFLKDIANIIQISQFNLSCNCKTSLLNVTN